jgi:hypothetical protein
MLLTALTLFCCRAYAQEIRRAEPVDKWRTLHGETCWHWLKRTGNCTKGGCEDDTGGGMAYLNWGDHKAPIMDNVEIEPGKPLLAPYPFIEPEITNPLYDYDAESEIRTRESNSGLTRVYRRGVFVGYTITTPAEPTKQQPEMVKI